MTIEEQIEGTVRRVVREELRAALAEHRGVVGDELMTYKEAAAFAKCSTSTIGAWVKAGALQAHGRGRMRRIKKEELLAAIDRGPLTRRTEDESPEERASAILGKGNIRRIR